MLNATKSPPCFASGRLNRRFVNYKKKDKKKKEVIKSSF